MPKWYKSEHDENAHLVNVCRVERRKYNENLVYTLKYTISIWKKKESSD